MTRLDPQKLHTTFSGVTSTSPIIPRKYTFTHSDMTGYLFLVIGSDYAYSNINNMRDEVLGEWSNMNGQYVLNINMFIDGTDPYSTVIRNAIFRRELPLALEAMVYGDSEFFRSNPQLYNSSIIVHLNSMLPYFNRIEKWGTPNDYK